MARVPVEDLERMRSLAADLPGQFERGFVLGSELVPSAPNGSHDATFVVGMGGSGVAGEFVRGLIERESSVSYHCLHAPELPASVGPASRVILVSYSGDTWEILKAREEARRRSARTIAITSGGELRRRAEREGDPVLLVPPNLPPRAAIGYTFGGLLGVVDPEFPESLEERVRRACEALEKYRGRVGGSTGLARRLAERIDDRLPFVYGEDALAAVARRWATSFEENSKRLAAFEVIPEAMHNALVGWDAAPLPIARRLIGVILEWGGTSAASRRAATFLERTMTRSRARAARVPLPAEDLLEALLQGIMLGDYVSLAVAERARANPVTIAAIERYRAWIERAG